MNKFIPLQKPRPWLKNYDPHIPQKIYYPKSSINALFDKTAEKFKDKPFLVWKGYEFTFSHVQQLVENLTNNLIRQGMVKGDRVALILPNIPQFVIAYYAILNAGGIVVAMNPNYKQDEYEFLFNDSCPKIVFCLEDHREIIKKLGYGIDFESIISTSLSDIPLLKSNEQEKEFDSDNSGFIKFTKSGKISKSKTWPKINPADPAVFQYSGGTTGIPKAAIGTHQNLTANVTQFQIWCDLKTGREVILAVIPLYHVYGMVLALNMSASIGAKLILIDDPRNIDLILDEIEKHRVTFYPGVPTMYYAINQNSRVRQGKCDLTSIKACISGSAPLHKLIKEEFERLTGGKLVEGYGLSEAPTATHCNPLFGINKTGSIGLPLPDVDCRIVDLETGLVDQAVGEPGELILKGPQVMKGYHNNLIENNLALREGWLFTGDVVKMDEDGYFYIVDRKKSLIKVGGFQVWPNEIEAVLNSHPLILESAVGGIPDIEKGEKILAWIVMKPDQMLRPEEIIQWCEKHLVYYKIPAEFLFIEKIPRTGVGKILRRELISEYAKKDPK